MSRQDRSIAVLFILGGFGVFLLGCDGTPEIIRPESTELIAPITDGATDLQLEFPDLRGPAETPDTRLANALPPPECLPDEPCGEEEDGGAGAPTEEELAVVSPEIFKDPKLTYTNGSLANVAEGYSHMTFTGDHATQTTEMELRFQGSVVANPPADEAEYRLTLYEFLQRIWGCDAGVLINGEAYFGCPHVLDTAIRGVELRDNCGHEMTVSSRHFVESSLSVYLWGVSLGSDRQNTSAYRTQKACETETRTETGDGGGGGVTPFCDEYTCLSTYVRTGTGPWILIQRICWCSSWSDLA